MSFGLDHHIPSKSNSNTIKTEFENFYYQTQKHLNHLSNTEKDNIKSKLRRTCENYSQISTKNIYYRTIYNLSKRKNIVVLKQDKGRGVVIMNKNKYEEKCLEHLNTNNFIKLDIDRTNNIETNVKNAVLKIKKKVSKDIYEKIYPSGSNPGKFYGTAKIHKLREEDKTNVELLPIRPIVSNIGTATYELAKYIGKIISPLGKSNYTINNTAEFIKSLEAIKIPEGFQMISFDVKNLFTNVPLEDTINIIMKKVYEENVIKTFFTPIELKFLLHLCTKEVLFSFNGNLYQQIDGIAMGSPLGSIIANIFMCQLENILMPTLNKFMTPWKRYVDDTFAFADPAKINNILEILNSYHPNIQFTYEIETNKQLPFLDVLLKRENSKIKTNIYRKSTNTNIYINWFSHSPNNWKIGTFSNLIKRATLICSQKEDLMNEIDYLKNVFVNINHYPPKTIDYIIKKEILEYTQSPTSNTTTLSSTNNKNIENNETNSITLTLPYKGKEGENIIKKMNKELKNVIQSNIKLLITFKSRKLESFFGVKDKTNLKHKHNIV